MVQGENKGGNGKRNDTDAVVQGQRPMEVYKMLFNPPLLSVVASGVLDMTADFIPLFVGMVVGVGLGALGLVFAIGVHDPWWTPRTTKKPIDHPVPAPEEFDAA